MSEFTGPVFYNPVSGLFNQRRETGWSGGCPFFHDSMTVNFNEDTSPPRHLSGGLILVDKTWPRMAKCIHTNFLCTPAKAIFRSSYWGIAGYEDKGPAF